MTPTCPVCDGPGERDVAMMADSSGTTFCVCEACYAALRQNSARLTDVVCGVCLRAEARRELDLHAAPVTEGDEERPLDADWRVSVCRDCRSTIQEHSNVSGSARAHPVRSVDEIAAPLDGEDAA